MRRDSRCTLVVPRRIDWPSRRNVAKPPPWDQNLLYFAVLSTIALLRHCVPLPNSDACYWTAINLLAFSSWYIFSYFLNNIDNDGIRRELAIDNFNAEPKREKTPSYFILQSRKVLFSQRVPSTIAMRGLNQSDVAKQQKNAHHAELIYVNVSETKHKGLAKGRTPLHVTTKQRQKLTSIMKASVDFNKEHDVTMNKEHDFNTCDHERIFFNVSL